MKTIKKKHFIIEYVIPDSEEEEQEIKKIIREIEEDTSKTDISEYIIEKPEDK